MTVTYHRMTVHDGGGMAVHLPLVDIGPAPFRVAVVAGIHGDEPAPLVLIDRLVDALRGQDLKYGVRIVAAANPPALLSKTRHGPWDMADMNRVGDAVNRPELTYRLARAVLQAVEGVTLCVNLHNFVMRTPFLAVDPPGQTGARRERQKLWLDALDPEVIWAFQESADDLRTYQSSLDYLIEQEGIDVVAVETSDLPQLQEGDLSRALAGLQRLALRAGCLEGTELPPTWGAVRVNRHLMRSPGAGIYVPLASLMGRVRRGQLVGELIPLERPGCRVPVHAVASGWVIQQAARGFMCPGNQIAAIGTDVTAL